MSASKEGFTSHHHTCTHTELPARYKTWLKTPNATGKIPVNFSAHLHCTHSTGTIELASAVAMNSDHLTDGFTFCHLDTGDSSPENSVCPPLSVRLCVFHFYCQLYTVYSALLILSFPLLLLLRLSPCPHIITPATLAAEPGELQWV